MDHGLVAGAAPADHDEGSPRGGFRGSIAQRLISLSTLRSGGYPPPRKTRFRLLVPALPDGIGYPQGSYRKVSTCNHSPFPSFLAQPAFLIENEQAHRPEPRNRFNE